MTCDTCLDACGPCQKCQGDRKSEGNVAGATQIIIRWLQGRTEEYRRINHRGLSLRRQGYSGHLHMSESNQVTLRVGRIN